MCSVEGIVFALKSGLSDLDVTDFNLPTSMLPSGDSLNDLSNSSSCFHRPDVGSPSMAELVERSGEVNTEYSPKNLTSMEASHDDDTLDVEREIKEEITQEMDDVIVGASITTGCEACTIDSDPDNVEICKQSSSSNEISDTHKLFTANVNVKRQLSKEKKPLANKNGSQSGVNPFKVPIQYRRCYVCALGCQFGSVECCRFCDNVFHHYCVEGIAERQHGWCGFNGCEPPTQVNSNFRTISTKQLSIPRGNELKANDSFCTSFVSKEQCLWPEWRLKRSFHNGNRTHISVPKAVKEAYRNFHKDKKQSKPHTYHAKNQNLLQAALSLQKKLSNEPKSSASTDLSLGSPRVHNDQNNSCSPGEAVYLLLVDESMENILERKELLFDKGYVSIGTDASKCDIQFSGMEQCRSCSPLHCRIFYSHIEKRFELLNYCQSGTIVDDVLYCLNKPDVRANCSAISTNSQSVRGQSRLPMENQRSSLCSCPTEYIADVNHNVSVVWEGSAVLNHGSRITIGCMTLVFVTA